MIKVTINRKDSDETEDFFYHERFEFFFQYLIAAIQIVFMAVFAFLFKDFIFSMICLLFSYDSYSEVKRMKRENLMIDFVVDLSQALNEKEQEGGQDEND
jgi:hypothetical protein